MLTLFFPTLYALPLGYCPAAPTNQNQPRPRRRGCSLPAAAPQEWRAAAHESRPPCTICCLPHCWLPLGSPPPPKTSLQQNQMATPSALNVSLPASSPWRPRTSPSSPWGLWNHPLPLPSTHMTQHTQCLHRWHTQQVNLHWIRCAASSLPSAPPPSLSLDMPMLHPVTANLSAFDQWMTLLNPNPSYPPLGDHEGLWNIVSHGQGRQECMKLLLRRTMELQ